MGFANVKHTTFTLVRWPLGGRKMIKGLRGGALMPLRFGEVLRTLPRYATLRGPLRGGPIRGGRAPPGARAAARRSCFSLVFFFAGVRGAQPPETVVPMNDSHCIV